MRLNHQPTEARTDKPEQVDIHSIFETIQGEGPFAGTPSVFVRLAGCNLQCPTCDTEYTNGRKILTPEESVVVVRGIRPSGLVVLTGGEPFRQDITKLVTQLVDAGYTVQIETNGAIYRSEFPFDYRPLRHKSRKVHIVCSPKTPAIAGQLPPHIQCYKYVVKDGQVSDKDGLPTKCMGGYDRPVFRPSTIDPSRIYIQPLDEQNTAFNSANRRAAVEVCLKHGYRLSFQMHKELNLP